MSFATRLLAWHERHGRHDLPWQHPRSAYRVWVSEIMLQQTTVRAVIPYFERFVTRLPDVRALAAAPLSEILELWSGLGYYARARNLHAAARRIVDEHGGEFPTDIDAVLALPGIGRSTAAAILAQAFGQRHAILDGNVKRVLARHQAVEGWPGRPQVEKALWAISERLTPSRRVADYTQAIMDLGASVCGRRSPDCAHCPVATDCQARAQGRTGELPTPRPRAGARRSRSTRMLIIVDAAGQVLLEQRPPSGIWGGLLCFPEIDAGADAERACRERFALRAAKVRELAPVEHSFTHFDLTISPLRIDVLPEGLMDAAAQAWYNPAHHDRLGTPAPVTRLLRELSS